MDPNVDVGRRLGRLGALEVARGRVGDAPCVVLRGEGAASVGVGHRALDCELIPRVLAEGDNWVALAADGVATLDECLRALPLRSVPYAEAIVVPWTLARALSEAHARGVTLGTVGRGNLLVCADGSLRVLGFGSIRAGWAVDGACAPAVAAGRTPSSATDVHTGLLFVRSIVPWLEKAPERLERLLAGEVGPLERSFHRALLGVLGLTGPADGARALEALSRFWRSLGVTPDAPALAERLVALRRDPRLTVGPESAYFSVDGGPRADLTRRRAARLVLGALVATAPAPCSAEALVEAGWPGEVLLGTSGADRLYVLLSTLRDLGLRDLLTRTERGYALEASVRIEHA